MRTPGLCLVAFFCVFAIFACKEHGSGHDPTASSDLTAAKAQAAVNLAMQQRFTNWRTSGGTVQVQGVQLSGDGAGAQADLTFSNVSINCVLGGANTKDVWDRGLAIFRHYTDGRWVLVAIQLDPTIYHACGGGEWRGAISVH